MSAFRWSMQNASPILFGIALLMVVASLAIGLISANQTPMGMERMSTPMLLGAIAGAFQSGAWPFFGAALLWRADRWLPQNKIMDDAQ